MFVNKEVPVTENEMSTRAAFAILTMATVKEAADAFDRGDVNVCDALEAIVDAVGAYADVCHEAARPRRAAA